MTIPNAVILLMNFCVINIIGIWVYPFGINGKVDEWLESVITRERTMSQVNYCMRKNTELQHTTVS